jgi:hypothetical protein
MISCSLPDCSRVAVEKHGLNRGKTLSRAWGSVPISLGCMPKRKTLAMNQLVKVKAAQAVKSVKLAPVALRRMLPALALVAALCLLAVSGVHADPAALPVIPPTDTFNSSFADVQTWSTSLIAGPGKYVIYIMLSFIGFGLVVGWIRKSVKIH